MNNKQKAQGCELDDIDSLETHDSDGYESIEKSDSDDDNGSRSTRFKNIRSKMAAISVSTKKENVEKVIVTNGETVQDPIQNEVVEKTNSDSPKYWNINSSEPRPVEKDYDDIKNNPNKIWEKYELKVRKITNSLAYMKNFDANELYQQSYIYFVDLCKNYDPYYQGNFFPFEKYFFKNLIIRIRAHIQGYYFKQKREQPTEFSEYRTKSDDTSGDDLYLEYLLSLLPEKQRMIVQLSLIEGYNQQEVGQMIGVSQSRVSVIRKKALTFLKENIEKRKSK